MSTQTMLENLNERLKAIDSEFQGHGRRLQDIDSTIVQLQGEAKMLRDRHNMLRGASAELQTLKTQLEAPAEPKLTPVPVEGEKAEEVPADKPKEESKAEESKAEVPGKPSAELTAKVKEAKSKES